MIETQAAPQTSGATSDVPVSRRAKIVKRCIGGAVAIGILAAILWIDRGLDRPWISIYVVTILGIVAAWELFSIVAKAGFPVSRVFAFTTAGLALGYKTFCLHHGYSAGSFALAVICGFAIVSWAVEVIRGDARGAVQRIAFGLSGLVYVLLYSFLLDVVFVTPAPRGVELALYIVLVSKGNDIGGFLVGNWLGGRKLAPKVSPGKTWSGSIGGMALSIGIAFAGASRVGLDGVALVLGFALVVSVATQFGDLAESLLKRACNVKDSGRLLPTFGGALDVIDSLAFAAPCGFAYLTVTGSLSPF